jgi:hypothetical protein
VPAQGNDGLNVFAHGRGLSADVIQVSSMV